MNLKTLTLKPLRVRCNETQDYKQRLDPVLVRLVQESVQRRAPHLKVGKRVALESVLVQYLNEQNLLRECPELPGLAEKDPLTASENKENGGHRVS